MKAIAMVARGLTLGPALGKVYEVALVQRGVSPKLAKFVAHVGAQVTIYYLAKAE